ncbi:small multi-drug export protein [Carboxylicivirga sediminis]|uniref:Small multi-drug export protein n=1 Tax=Carboxylicivirga sediminis TaxID=2006564 RepID=A0A941IWE3_9BACT|nr:small multi-drug export protein [Carboxylicivirga sediminis]MBR8535711.1 small multi-drug export protein [Carboxylicivirga sediminis]
MEEIAKYFAVYLTGATGIYKGIPVGIALGLKPLLIASLVALGAMSSALLVYFSGEPFRRWLLKKYGNKTFEHKKAKFAKWMDKYGVPGLGLMVTGLLGPFIALIIGMALLDDTRKFLLYLLAGIVLWSFGLTYLTEPVVQLVKGWLN